MFRKCAMAKAQLKETLSRAARQFRGLFHYSDSTKPEIGGIPVRTWQGSHNGQSSGWEFQAKVTGANSIFKTDIFQKLNVLRHGHSVCKYKQTNTKTYDMNRVLSRHAPGMIGGRKIQLQQAALVIGRNARPLWRGYYVDKYGVKHFKARGPDSWFKGEERGAFSQKLLYLILFASGGLGVIYYTHLEVVPYTKRKHFVLISPETERRLGEMTFQDFKKQVKNKILPPYHPAVVRIHQMAEKLIKASMSGIEAQDWGQIEYGHKNAGNADIRGDEDVDELQMFLTEAMNPLKVFGEGEEALDDAWVEQSRHKGASKGRQGNTIHLQGMQWEVVVVNADICNAFCLPGGKIVVFTGILNAFCTDAEVATVLSHEIAHALARHTAETLTRSIFLVSFELMALAVLNMPGVIGTAADLLLRLPFSRRMEVEADRIGLLTMAAAGYDPRVAPSVYEKLDKVAKVPEYVQYLSTHPSGKKRAELLRNSTTMQEAIRIYESNMVDTPRSWGFLFM